MYSLYMPLIRRTLSVPILPLNSTTNRKIGRDVNLLPTERESDLAMESAILSFVQLSKTSKLLILSFVHNFVT